MATYRLVKLDPFHATLGILTHYVGQRIQEYAKKAMPEMQPEQVASHALARLYSRDPRVLILAAVDTETGKVGGHVWANFDDQAQLVTVDQYHMDNDIGEMGLEALAMVDNWAKQLGLAPERVELVTTNRGDRWHKRGFRVVRYIYVRDGGGSEVVSEDN